MHTKTEENKKIPNIFFSYLRVFYSIVLSFLLTKNSVEYIKIRYIILLVFVANIILRVSIYFHTILISGEFPLAKISFR